MSLINDALKRAKQAQQKNDPPPSAPSTPLRPAEPARPGDSPTGLLWPIAVALLLLMIGAGVVWFVVNRSGATKSVARVPTSKPATQAASATTPMPIPTSSQANPVPVVRSHPPAAPSPASAPAPTVTSPGQIPLATNVPAIATEAPPALPKLQGILYRPDRPSALLNGRTVLIGGRSGEFLVVAITQQSVTVVRAGQTNVLSLPE